MADLNVTVYTSPYGIVGAKGSDGVLSTSGVITYNGFTGNVQGVSSWNGKTGALQGVCTWNGLTGDVTGVTTGVANNFKALQSFSNGISASGGMTLAGTLDTTGNIKFIGITSKTIQSTQAPITIQGATSGPISYGNYNAIILGVQTDDPLKLYSATGIVNVNYSDTSGNAYTTGAKLNTYSGDFGGAIYGSATIQPSTYFTANRTISIPDDSGTIALTKNVVTSLNGKTGALQGVCAMNGLTGTVGLSAGININIATVGNTLTVATTSNVAKTDTAQTFTALQNFSSGISASDIVYPLNTGILPVNSSSTGITGSWFFAQDSGTYYIYFCFGLGWRRVAMNTF